jgi:hypothetical protein
MAINKKLLLMQYFRIENNLVELLKKKDNIQKIGNIEAPYKFHISFET